MSLKCSIFGHTYGDTEIDREREEDGSEVVITIRETETCQRCGETRVVSENKEVTTLETAADIVSDDLDESDEVPRGETGDEQMQADDSSWGESPGTVSAGETTIPDAEGGTPSSGSSGVEQSVPTDASEDDAIILDDEDDEDDRAPGEWPDEPDDTDDEESADGADKSDGESGGDEELDLPDEDAELIDADEHQSEESPHRDETVDLSDEAESATDTDDQPVAEWPDEDDDCAPSTTGESPEDDSPDVEPPGTAVTVPEGEFYCPECEFTTPVESSSLRAGDFCPKCHRGALEHRAE